jgi:hypothetical protein
METTAAATAATAGKRLVGDQRDNHHGHYEDA